MSNRLVTCTIVLGCLLGFRTGLAQEELPLSTLFTTPQERQIINANRYKRETKPGNLQQLSAVSEPEAVRELVKEEVRKLYKISGISVSMDGAQLAWINDQSYEHGAQLEDGSRLRINNAAIKSVSIITPDGKRHTATSGETLEVVYQRTVNE